MSKAGLAARRPAGPGRRAKHAAGDALAFLLYYTYGPLTCPYRSTLRAI